MTHKGLFITGPPTKFEKGNVFIMSVRHSVHTDGHHVTITHDALDFTVQPPLSPSPHPDNRHGDTPPAPALAPTRHGIPLVETSSAHHWRPLHTSLYKPLLPVLTSGSTEAHTVGKQAVHILLVYLLVKCVFTMCLGFSVFNSLVQICGFLFGRWG